MPQLTRRNALVAAAATCLPRAARAARRIVQIGYDEPSGSVSGAACRALAQAVAAHPDLQNAVEIELYSDTVVQNATVLMNLCRSGELDMAIVPASVVASRLPAFNLLEAPCVFTSAAQARTTLDGPAGQEFAALAALDRVVILGWGEIGFEHVTAQRPVHTPADLVGLKVAVSPSKVVAASFAGFGATPVVCAEGDMFAMLHNGDLDAAERSVLETQVAGLLKAQHAISLTAHRYNASVFQACVDLVDELTSNQLQALSDCAVKAAGVTRRLVEATDATGIQRLTKAGMQIVTDVDSAAFLSRARPVQVALGQSYGAEKLARLLHG